MGLIIIHDDVARGGVTHHRPTTRPGHDLHGADVRKESERNDDDDTINASMEE